LSRRGFLYVKDGFEAELEGRVDRDRLLDFGQIVGFQDGVSAELTDADEELMEGEGLGYFPFLKKMSRIRFWAASWSAAEPPGRSHQVNTYFISRTPFPRPPPGQLRSG